MHQLTPSLCMPLFSPFPSPTCSKQSIAWAKWEWPRESFSTLVHKDGFRSRLELLLQYHRRKKQGKEELPEQCMYVSPLFPPHPPNLETKNDNEYVRRIGKWKGCEKTQGLQTTGSSGQRQVTDTQLCHRATVSAAWQAQAGPDP